MGSSYLNLSVRQHLTVVNLLFTLFYMIKTFKHKGLTELYKTGKSRLVKYAFHDKCIRLMDTLEQSTVPEDMNIPGFRFHGLNGNPKRYSVKVSGNYRLTFGWDGVDAIKLDLEDYH